MVTRRLEAFAVAVGSLPSVVVFVALLLSGIGIVTLERLDPGWPRALVVAGCDAVTFGWIWSVGAVATRARDAALSRGALAWVAIATASVVLRGWIELADAVSLRPISVSPSQAATILGAVLVVVTNFGLPIWAAVRLGAVRPEPWRWIECAGGAVLLVFSPIGVWWVQPWLHELLRDAPGARR